MGGSLLTSERRRAPRRAPRPSEPLAYLRVRTGRELVVLDLSDTGALVEGARLLPGTHVDVHVVTREGRVLVRSRVMRAAVCDLQPDIVRYRAALAFDRPIPTQPHGYDVPVPMAPEHSQAPVTGTSYPHHDPDRSGPAAEPA